MMGRSGITYQNTDVPDVDAVAPRDLQADLWRPIHVRLHIFIMRDIPRYSRAKVAKNGLSDAFRQVEPSGSIDGVSVDFFTRRGVLLFRFDECSDDRLVLDFHEDVTGGNIWNTMSAFFTCR